MYHALLTLTFASALASGGVVSLDVNKVTVTHHESLAKRATTGRSPTVLDIISNQRFYYTTDVLIGTPAQKQNLLLDTGSADTWVFGTGNNAFDSTKSSTYHSNGTNWNIQYGIGTASGNWGTDKFKIGGAEVNSLSIGTATRAQQVNQGIIGLGRKQAEVTNKQGSTYENLPLRMKSEGIISTAAYSMYLNDINAQSGTILFGGVDHSKYAGNLVTLPISHPRHLGVTLNGIYMDGREKGNNLQKPNTAVLDSGTSLTYVPHDTLISIQGALNANPSFSIGERYYCDCNITENLVLDFGATKIPVPAYNFLWPIENFVSGQTAATNFPQNSCYLGIESSSADQDFILLGDNILRGLYIVYDVEHDTISLAPSANQGASNVQAIVGGSIPKKH